VRRDDERGRDTADDHVRGDRAEHQTTPTGSPVCRHDDQWIGLRSRQVTEDGRRVTFLDDDAHGRGLRQRLRHAFQVLAALASPVLEQCPQEFLLPQ